MCIFSFSPGLIAALVPGLAPDPAHDLKRVVAAQGLGLDLDPVPDLALLVVPGLDPFRPAQGPDRAPGLGPRAGPGLARPRPITPDQTTETGPRAQKRMPRWISMMTDWGQVLFK